MRPGGIPCGASFAYVDTTVLIFSTDLELECDGYKLGSGGKQSLELDLELGTY